MADELKTFTCLECGEHGCKLEAGSEATNPTMCPFGAPKQTVRWMLEEKANKDRKSCEIIEEQSCMNPDDVLSFKE